MELGHWVTGSVGHLGHLSEYNMLTIMHVRCTHACANYSLDRSLSGVNQGPRANNCHGRRLALIRHSRCVGLVRAGGRVLGHGGSDDARRPLRLAPAETRGRRRQAQVGRVPPRHRRVPRRSRRLRQVLRADGQRTSSQFGLGVASYANYVRVGGAYTHTRLTALCPGLPG